MPFFTCFPKQKKTSEKIEEADSGSLSEFTSLRKQEISVKTKGLNFLWDLIDNYRKTGLFAWALPLAVVKVSSGWVGQARRLPDFLYSMPALYALGVLLRLIAQRSNLSGRAKTGCHPAAFDAIKDLVITQGTVSFLYLLEFFMDAWLSIKHAYGKDPEVNIEPYEAFLIIAAAGAIGFSGAAASFIYQANKNKQWCFVGKEGQPSSKKFDTFVSAVSFFHGMVVNGAIIHGAVRICAPPFLKHDSAVPMWLVPPNTPTTPAFDFKQLDINVGSASAAGIVSKVIEKILNDLPASMQSKFNQTLGINFKTFIASVFPTMACVILGYSAYVLSNTAYEAGAFDEKAYGIWFKLFIAALALPLIEAAYIHFSCSCQFGKRKEKNERTKIQTEEEVKRLLRGEEKEEEHEKEHEEITGEKIIEVHLEQETKKGNGGGSSKMEEEIITVEEEKQGQAIYVRPLRFQPF